MLRLAKNYFFTGEEVTKSELQALLKLASKLKAARNKGQAFNYLAGKHLALLFDKPSLRTRVSFTVAMRELGGDVVESIAATRKPEDPADQVRVLEGYCHAIMFRTSDDSYLSRMQNFSSIPIINGLSDLHHPCQILADLLTLQERFGKLDGLTLTYVGDGNNILHSLLLLAPSLNIHLRYCCPSGRGPNAEIVQRAHASAQKSKGSIKACANPIFSVTRANAVYTDVWASMGFEDQVDEHVFDGFQVNEQLMSYAAKDAVLLHCLPMVRGKEVSETLPDSSASVIFQQSENRLHVQKALLVSLIG